MHSPKTEEENYTGLKEEHMIAPKPQTHAHNQNSTFFCAHLGRRRWIWQGCAKRTPALYDDFCLPNSCPPSTIQWFFMEGMGVPCKEKSRPLWWFLLAKLPPALYDMMISAGAQPPKNDLKCSQLKDNFGGAWILRLLMWPVLMEMMWIMMTLHSMLCVCQNLTATYMMWLIKECVKCMMWMMLSIIRWSNGKKIALSIPMLQTLLTNTLPFLQLKHH